MGPLGSWGTLWDLGGPFGPSFWVLNPGLPDGPKCYFLKIQDFVFLKYTQSIFRKLFNQLRPESIHDFPETQNGGAVILDHLDCQKHGLDENIKLGQGF